MFPQLTTSIRSMSKKACVKKGPMKTEGQILFLSEKRLEKLAEPDKMT